MGFLALLILGLISSSFALYDCPYPIPDGGVMRPDTVQQYHNVFVQEVQQTSADIVFIGDSIIEILKGMNVWQAAQGFLNAINLGVGGDTVEHVQWRIVNGEFNFNHPIKVVVQFVGTNNYNCAPDYIFEAIVKLAEKTIQLLGNDVKIVLPTLLPRSQYDDTARETIIATNCLLINKFGPGSNDPLKRNVHLIRIDQHIVQPDGSIPDSILYDYLHPTNPAYTTIFGPVINYARDLRDGQNYDPQIDTNCHNLV